MHRPAIARVALTLQLASNRPGFVPPHSGPGWGWAPPSQSDTRPKNERERCFQRGVWRGGSACVVWLLVLFAVYLRANGMGRVALLGTRVYTLKRAFFQFSKREISRTAT